MAASKYDTVLETRFVSPTPPLLTRMSREAFHGFRKAYDRYLQLIGIEYKDEDQLVETDESIKIKRVCMYRCVDEDLARAIRAEYGAEKMADDTRFRAFVIEQAAVTSVEQAKAMFRAIRMDLRIKDINERVASYNSSFLQVKDQTDDIGWKEKRICNFYIEGLRPERVQNTLIELTETRAGKTLEGIMKRAKELLIAENHLYAAPASESRDKSDHHHRSEQQERHGDHHHRSEQQERHSEHHHHHQSHVRDTYNSHAIKSEVATVEDTPVRKCFNCGVVGHQWRKCRKPLKPELQARKKTEDQKHHGQRIMHKAVNSVSAVDQQSEDGSSSSASSDTEADEHKASSSDSDSDPNEEHVNCVESVPVINQVDTHKKHHSPLMCKVWVKQKVYAGIVDTGAGSSCVSQALIDELDPTDFHIVLDERGDVVETHAKVADGTVVKCLYAHITIKLTVRHQPNTLSIPWDFIVLPDRTRTVFLLGADLLESVGLLTSDELVIPMNDRHDSDDEDDGDDIDTDHVYTGYVGIMAVEHKGVSTASTVSEVTYADTPVKQAAQEILTGFSDVFADVPHPDGIDYVPMKIQLKPGASSVSAKPRKLPPRVRNGVAEILDTWKLLSVVEPGDMTSGQWASGLVVVPKKVDTTTKSTVSQDKKPPDQLKASEIRVCVDYRALNAETVPIAAPMMNIHTVTECAAGCKYYGKLDMTNGYLQMNLDEPSRDMTAFVTETEFLRFRRIPFGLKNAPQFFQQAMNTMFRDLLYKAVIIFVDDMLVFGHDEDEFLTNMRKVLERCRQKRIHLKGKKSIIGATEIDVVGLHLSSQGRSLSKASTAALEVMPVPQSMEDVQTFVGKINFFRDFIPRCSDVLQPLTSILGKGRHFIWGKEQQQSFDTCRRQLIETAALVHITEDSQLILCTDASNVGCGGVLLVRGADKKERPACFFSHKFTESQARWPTIQQELYAIVFCLSRPLYSQLFKSVRFTIRTDHRNLVYLHKLASTSKMIQGWRFFLQDYQFDIVHIPGSMNAAADCLSRLVSTNAVDEEVPEVVLEAAEPPRDNAGDDQYHGHLQELMEVHGGINGHYGRQVTLVALRDSGKDWKTIKEDVKKYIEACLECQKIKHSAKTLMERYPLRTTKVMLPFRVVAVDCIGPFPATADGYRYIIVFIDCFTRWVELVPTRTLEAGEAADAYMHAIFARHGLPLVIRSDNGTQFTNALITKLLEKLHVEQHKVLPYSPASNGIVERCNKEVLEQLRCLCLEFGVSYDEWQKLLPMVMFIVNRTTHSAIGTSPHRCLYGDLFEPISDAKKVLDIADERNDAEVAQPGPAASAHNTRRVRRSVLEVFPELGDEVVQRDEASKYLHDVSKRIRTIQEAARITQDDEVANRLRKRNKGKHEREFELGELVLYTEEAHYPRMNKLQPVMHGPYKIVKRIGEDEQKLPVYQIESIVNPGATRDVHCHGLIKLVLDDSYPASAIMRTAQHDEEEWVVREVLGHRGDSKSTLEVLVTLEGIEDSRYLPWKDVKNCDIVEVYMDEHDDTRRIVRSRQRM